MTLSEEEKTLIQATIDTVDKLNTQLTNLRNKGFACNIKEGPPMTPLGMSVPHAHWLLDIKALIRAKDYKNAKEQFST